MAERLLTLADVYKPMTVNDMLNAQSAAMQNKLSQLQMNELQKKLSKDEQVQNVLRDLYSPAQPQIGTPAQPQQGTGANITLDSGTGTTGNYFQQALGGNRPKMSLGNFNAQMPSPDYQSAQPASPDYRPAQPEGINPAAMERLRQIDPEKAMGMQAQIQAQKREAFQSKWKIYEPMFKQFADNGDNEGYKSLWDTVASKDPDIAGVLPPDFKLPTVTGKGEVESTVNIPEGGMINPKTKKPFADPVSGQPITKGGMYSIKAKTSGQELSVKPVDPAENKTKLYERANKGDKEAQAILDKMNADDIRKAEASGEARARAFGSYRPVQVLDTKNGNRPITITADELKDANKKEPGRYLSASGGEKALTRTAVIVDIRDAIGNVKQSISNLKTDFTPAMRAQIALVMKDRSPKSAISNWLGSDMAATLTPDQVDYITDLAQIQENAMAMRSVLGAGQGSEDLRAAILRTVPSMLTPNREYALKQLDKFNQQLNRLERGVPSAPLRTDTGKTTNAPGSGSRPPLSAIFGN